MLNGSFSTENILIFVSGAIAILVGVGLIRWRSEAEAAASDIQRGMGPVGRKIANRPQRWATITVGVMFIAFGVLFMVLALLTQL